VSNVIVGFGKRMIAAGAHVLLIEGHAGVGKVNSRAQQSVNVYGEQLRWSRKDDVAEGDLLLGIHDGSWVSVQ